MAHILRNKKASALLLSMITIIFLISVTAAALLRYITEQKSTNSTLGRIKGIFNAEEGIYYAYAELSKNAFNWGTHEWKNSQLQKIANPTFSVAQAGFNNDGSYYVANHNFKVIVFPELRTDGSETNVVIVRSQGLDNTAAPLRTIELRVSKQSLFDYFYFFPYDKTFSTATYDGAGYGKMHANGNIYFSGNPIFINLTELSTAGKFALSNSQYASPYSFDNNNTTIDGKADLYGSSAPPYEYYLPSSLYNPGYFFNGNYYPSANNNATVDGIKLPITLATSWKWDQYSGTKTQAEVPVSFTVDNNALSWLASNKSFLPPADYASFSAAVIDGTTDSFWNAWKAANYTDANTSTTGNLARAYWTTFLGPTYINNYVNNEWWTDLVYGNGRTTDASSDLIDVNFLDTSQQTSDWSSWLSGKKVDIVKQDTNATGTLDLQDILKDNSNGGKYLTPIDIQTDYKAKASSGGILLGQVETSGYTAWLNQPRTFTYSGHTFNYTMRQDANVYTWGTNRVEYITAKDDTVNRFCAAAGYDQDCSDCYDLRDAFESELSSNYYAGDVMGWNTEELEEKGIVSFKEFYNPVRPAGSSSYLNDSQNIASAKKTKALNIDVEKLRAYLAGKDYNGIIYVETPDESDLSYDYSVSLTNAGILPEKGLTLVTPHNIYVNGSFNLDYTRDSATEAFTHYQATHTENNSNDYKWRNAALISTKRLIYTVSDQFLDYAANLSSFSDIASYHYWEPNSSSTSYPYSLGSLNFINTYLNAAGVTGNNSPQAVKDFYAKYPGLSIPGLWTPADIEFLKSKAVYDPSAATAAKALLDAGEQNYATATESKQPNRVLYDITYNTAMVSAYDPSGYTLERWINSSGQTVKRNITGAFIQLTADKRASVPSNYSIKVGGKFCYQVGPGYDYWGYYRSGRFGSNRYVPQFSDAYNPIYNYAYEINFAKNSASGASTGPIATGKKSWIELPNSDFFPVKKIYCP
ncbi:MAG: hypothetical protein MUF05_00435 [Candidatus Omnitrophica bacterium]|jgi:hypothetical protein|nr:hypothetical protein [Candidatus Omnitrophota bacterium]